MFYIVSTGFGHVYKLIRTKYKYCIKYTGGVIAKILEVFNETAFCLTLIRMDDMRFYVLSTMF